MSHGSLKRSSLRAQASEVIRAGIVAGQFEPGEIYSANTIADQLGVSATPIREAMLDLANSGLVEPVRNRGFRILTMADKDLDEISELRLLIEPPTMRKVVELATDEEIAELDAAVLAIETAASDQDVAAFLVADRKFHLALLDLAGNARLSRLVEQLRDQTRLLGLRGLAVEGLSASAHEHREILEALRERRADDAVELMRVHLEHTRGVWAGLPEQSA
jgi:DNA-binding GntR family transcriptional regulator